VAEWQGAVETTHRTRVTVCEMMTTAARCNGSAVQRSAAQRSAVQSSAAQRRGTSLSNIVNTVVCYAPATSSCTKVP